MIIGPPDTLYYGGFYFFKFLFPSNYPYSPPKLTYLTNDGYIRFNPNLYTNGKVCISILNTWHGDQWSSCQTISSVLLTLCTVLNNNPLLNEPGIQKTNFNIPNYNRIIRYSNISVAICDMINKSRLPDSFEKFYPIMKKHFLENYENYMNIIDEYSKNKEETNIIVEMFTYDLKMFIDYDALRKKIKGCKDTI